MKKLIWCMAAVCLLSLLPAAYPVRAAEKTVTIRVHYFRYQQDYENWSLWLWEPGSDGKEYPLVWHPDRGWALAEAELTTDQNQAGILLKYGNWEKKDTNDDRFLDLSLAKDGQLDVYLIEAEETVYYTEEEISGQKRVVRCAYDDLQQVSFQLYCPNTTEEEIRRQGVYVQEPDGSRSRLSLLELNRDQNLITGTGRLDQPADLSAGGVLSLEGFDAKTIAMGNVFSTPGFEKAYCYSGDDLGAVYGREATAFRVWAPTASQVTLNLYETGDGDDLLATHPMTRAEGGTWYLELPGDWNGVYYTYAVTVAQKTQEAVDPYAKACGVDGQRGMVIDLEKTDPEGFAEEEKPPLSSFSDIILYEMSVRDYTADPGSGVTQKGKYLGLTEEGTVNENGDPTGLDYLGELGVTHVHLLPTQDFAGIEEKTPADAYNWGYNPQNYNVPEGSYSTDPYQGQVRVREYKQMVQSLHQKGLRVVMDVVYNHTYETEQSNFNKIVPGYYYRMTEEGTYSNGSACGNEIATERAMARKFILDSVTYWAEEYHVDGFRFDLMGLIDLETMRLIREKLDAIDRSIFIYGEGWTGGESSSTVPMAESQNARNMPGIAVFSNVFRNGVQNYVSGFLDGDGAKNSVLFGLVAATQNEITAKTMGSWTESPDQCINYASCHDGYTLWDLIRQNCQNESEENWRKRNKLSAAIVMTVQGIPFIQSGEELLRSKTAPEKEGRIYSNSYMAGDEVNAICWDSETREREILEYYKGLMAFRKIHPGLTCESAQELEARLKLQQDAPENVIAYAVKEHKNLFLENTLYVIYNPNPTACSMPLPKGKWNVYIDGENAGTQILRTMQGGQPFDVAALSALVMVRTTPRRETLGAISVLALLLLILALPVRRKERRRRDIKNERAGNV